MNPLQHLVIMKILMERLVQARDLSDTLIKTSNIPRRKVLYPAPRFPDGETEAGRD